MQLAKDNFRSAGPNISYILSCVKPGNTVLNFNYDNIVEKVLQSAKELNPWTEIEWRHGDGFGFRLPKVFLHAGADAAKMHPHLTVVDDELVSETAAAGSNVKLLNLHGSAFWEWESDKSRLVFTASYLFRRSTLDAVEITAVTRPLMAEPRKIKALSQGVLPSIWSSAREALSEAERVVVIGYSFPPADGAVEDLIKDCLKKNKCRILVIDPSPRDSHRLVSIFGERVSYFEGTLDQYVEYLLEPGRPDSQEY